MFFKLASINYDCVRSVSLSGNLVTLICFSHWALSILTNHFNHWVLDRQRLILRIVTQFVNRPSIKAVGAKATEAKKNIHRCWPTVQTKSCLAASQWPWTTSMGSHEVRTSECSPSRVCAVVRSERSTPTIRKFMKGEGHLIWNPNCHRTCACSSVVKNDIQSYTHSYDDDDFSSGGHRFRPWTVKVTN